MAYEEFITNALGGEAIVALIAASIMLFLLILIGIYIYTSLAWMTIARKLKYENAWLAWIPIARWAMILHLGSFHWAWIFLILIPIAGWIALLVLLIIASWRIFEKRDYPGWFSLAIIIPQVGWILYLIIIGFVAWSEKEDKKKRSVRKKSRR